MDLATSWDHLIIQFNAPTVPTEIPKLLKDFLELGHKIQSLGLFSLNESIEECSTSSLRYMAIGYYLGMLTQKLATSSLEERMDALSLAQEQIGGFLKLVRAYKIDGIPEDEAKLDRRSKKIERFRRIKQLTEATQIPVTSNTDEEVVREYRLNELRLRAIQAMDEIDLIESELEVLKSRKDTPEGAVEPPPKPAPPMIPGLRKVMQTFTLVKGRDQIRKDVFKPGHNLPTMTIDEYLELERQRGGIIDGGGPQSAGQELDEAAKEDARDYDEVEIYKKRQFDAFKDDNRRGSGNTYNRG